MKYTTIFLFLAFGWWVLDGGWWVLDVEFWIFEFLILIVGLGDEKNLVKINLLHLRCTLLNYLKNCNTKKKYILSKQLLRSATSVGANITKIEAAQSKSNFIHKLSIAAKEARESIYWLLLLQQSQLVQINVDEYLLEVESII